MQRACRPAAVLPYAAALLAALANTSPAWAQETRTTPVPRSADGIGRAYMGREIASVMGWQGAAWLEREEREREERTDVLLKALALQPGMVVADIGAGTGYLTRRMVPAVLPGGRVLAVDVQPQMVRALQTLARQPGLAAIAPSLGTETDVQIAPASVDLAIMVDVYHELAHPTGCPGAWEGNMGRLCQPGYRPTKRRAVRTARLEVHARGEAGAHGSPVPSFHEWLYPPTLPGFVTLRSRGA